MSEKLGFDDTLTIALIGSVAVFALGGLLGNISAFEDVDAATETNLMAVSSILMDLGMIGAGAVLVLAAIRAEGHASGIRIAMVVLGVLLVFQNVFDFNLGFNVAGSN